MLSGNGLAVICKNISAVRSGSAKSLYFFVYRNTPFLFMSAVVYSCLAQYIEKNQDIENYSTIYSIWER